MIRDRAIAYDAMRIYRIREEEGEERNVASIDSKVDLFYPRAEGCRYDTITILPLILKPKRKRPINNG